MWCGLKYCHSEKVCLTAPSLSFFSEVFLNFHCIEEARNFWWHDNHITDKHVEARAHAVRMPRWMLWKLSPAFVARQKVEERAIHLSIHFFTMRSMCLPPPKIVTIISLTSKISRIKMHVLNVLMVGGTLKLSLGCWINFRRQGATCSRSALWFQLYRRE